MSTALASVVGASIAGIAGLETTIAGLALAIEWMGFKSGGALASRAARAMEPNDDAAVRLTDDIGPGPERGAGPRIELELAG